jgi:hypothetical protein
VEEGGDEGGGATGVNIKAGNIVDEFTESGYGRNTGHFKPSSLRNFSINVMTHNIYFTLCFSEISF